VQGPVVYALRAIELHLKGPKSLLCRSRARVLASADTCTAVSHPLTPAAV
jgi:hypothetical protein